MTSTEKLPEFENPPVVEVVCGITFKPIEQLTIPRIGQLWDEYRDDYPGCSEQAPLLPIIESYEQAQPQAQINLGMTPRSWFTSKDGQALIQIQKDRFLHNWKKIDQSVQYPRYERVINMFRSSFERFEKYLARESLGNVQHLQYEMTYVNHIPFDGAKDSLGNIVSLFPDLSWRNSESRFLRAPNDFNWRASFHLPENRGKLRVGLTSGTLIADQTPIFRLDMTVRGIPRGEPSNESMYNWFGEAREWIVRGFDDLTADEAKIKQWGKY